MDKRMKKIRKDFVKAHKVYLRDMKWLREKFGIIPETKDFALKKAFSSSLDLILENTPESFEKSLKAFKEFHRKIIYDAAWSLLERTKENLKLLQDTEPKLFEEKRKLWIQASWALSEAGYKKNFCRYYDCIDIVSRI
jgi:hypothetical protein